MQQQQLKTKQARERLQFNQSRDVAIAFPANCKIDYVKIRMPRFIRNFQSLGNCVLRVAREFWRAGKIDNRMRSTRYVIRKFAGQKNRCLRNSEIRWPFLSFIHAAQERREFVRREVSVESGTKLRVHFATLAARLLAVGLLVDYVVDMERTEDSSCVLIGEDNHTMTAWRDLGVINSGH